MRRLFPTGRSQLGASVPSSRDRNALRPPPQLAPFARAHLRRPWHAPARRIVPGSAGPARRDAECARSSSPGLRVAMRAPERSARPAVCGFGLAPPLVAFRPTVARRKPAAGEVRVARRPCSGLTSISRSSGERRLGNGALLADARRLGFAAHRAVHARPARGQAWSSAKAVRCKTRPWLGPRGVRSRFVGCGAGRERRSRAGRGGGSERGAVKRIAHVGHGSTPGPRRRVRPGCSSLTSRVRTSPSDTSRPGVLRQEAPRGGTRRLA